MRRTDCGIALDLETGGRRDPEVGLSKKGHQGYFAMKAHIGVNARRGLIHRLETTLGKVYDAKLTEDPVPSDGRVVFGDKGYRYNGAM